MGTSQAFTLNIDLKHFAFETGMVFRGLTISKKEDYWNAVIRATDQKKNAVYCINQGETPQEAIEGLTTLFTLKNTSYIWRLDSWG